MIFSKELLEELLPEAQFFGVPNGAKFDHLNVVDIPQFRPFAFERGLYFIVYDFHPGKDGWHESVIDRSANITHYSYDDRITFVVDDLVSDTKMSGLRYIRVPNIFDAIDRLRNHVFSITCPFIIGVAGSVGKTGCAQMIQSLIGEKCARAYAHKRITPFTLSSWFINCLKPSDTHVVFEYSMLRINHINELAQRVRPDIGVLLNITDVHLNVGGIETLDQILQAHRPLTDLPLITVVNADDPRACEINQKMDSLTFSLTTPLADAWVSKLTCGRMMCLMGNGNKGSVAIKFPRDDKPDLYYQQVAAAALIAIRCGTPIQRIKEILEKS
jgi:UDP-N-acetylmuramyl pentapeptide synthase